MGGLFGGGGDDGLVIGQHGFEEGAKLKVVLLEEWIVLVIVAAGALKTESEEDVGGGIGDFGKNQVPLPASIAVVVFVDPVSEEAGGDKCSRVIGEEFVASELFLEEAVVWLVLIERLDDVIAVSPGIGSIEVSAIAIGVGIADEIEPVSRPAFAIGGAIEKLIDKLFPCIGAVVVEKVFNLFVVWWETGDFEGESAQEGEAIGFGGGSQFLAEHGIEDKSVDIVAAP